MNTFLCSLKNAVVPAFLFLCLTLATVSASAQCGCTNPQACNFDPTATCDDGSCVFLSSTGLCIGTVDDSLCVSDPSTIQLNVLTNDVLMLGIDVIVVPMMADQCFSIVENGQVIFNDAAGDCCGDHLLSYALMIQGTIIDIAEVFICVECPKPDCTLIDLSEYAGDDSGVGNPDGGHGCVSVCENSTTTFYLPLDTNSTYVWGPVIGGTWVPGANDAEIIVTWGPYGSGSITVVVTDGNGNVQTITVCVDIMQAPTAAFTGPNYVCLGQNACFTNTSLNADVYFWDFGDGNTSNLQHPCHTYTTPGTYTIEMCASNFNYDDEGNPLCCCTDCVTMEIVVDPLPGPGIYCISTLCEGDSACYWTDATNCSSYIWTVLDANGNPVTFTGQGTDEICLQWLIGPFATITLDVAGCDSSYCNNPTTVTIPIISSVSTITGPTVVCENATETYTLPKWMSVIYDWTVTGGTILSGDSTHIVTIQWGNAGVGTIHVDYCSEFLEGLPEHDTPDCCGTADLTVLIKPEFSITNFGPSVVCVNSSSFIQASPTDSYTWTVVDTGNNSHPFSGQGTDNITINWTAPGTYIITAVPNNAATYCNASETVVITVLNVPKATGIDGPTSICPNQLAYYTAQTASTGVTFVWTVQNGTPATTTGTTVGITWGPTGPYSISLAQQLAYNPYCLSDTITLLVYPKNLGGPFTITGTANCTNSTQTYTLNGTLHPEATISWNVQLPAMGSVVSGQGTTVAGVQWNNTPGAATVNCDLTLCGVTTTISLPLTLVSPQLPIVTQSGNLCPCQNAFLNASGGCFNSYSWSTGDVTASTQIYTAQQYTLNTVDCNGCPATVYYTAVAAPTPIANITSGNPPGICIQSPHNVTMVTPCNTSYNYEWFCGVTSVSGPSLGNCTYTHTFMNAPGSYSYTVKVTDPSTGCCTTSLPFIVTESVCSGGGLPCIPETYTLTASATNSFPFCNTVNFSFTSTNFTSPTWYFGDGNTSTSASPTHTYQQAGCYNVVLSGLVPEAGTGGASFCAVSTSIGVCVPLAADFDWSMLGCTNVQFNDLSTFIPGAGNNIISWSWTFCDNTNTPIGGGSGQTPTFNFPGAGTYFVKLLVMNANGCRALITKTVVISSVGTPVITAPLSACVGDPVVMSAFATGAVSYFWDFGDGSFFTGANPSHTYLAMGTYTITVTATDSNGCTATSSTTIQIWPPVAPATITGPLTICAGSSTTLCAPFGYSYNWLPGNINTQCISVLTGGTYSVTITDANLCSLELEPVEVVVLPLPVATIAGNLIICDGGCTMLTAPYDPNNTYQWYDNLGNPIAGEIYNQIYVCDYNLLGGYYVVVTDQNGCSATSATVVVSVEVSPVFTITISPVACAGQPVTLTVTPIDPNVNYNWSNGGTGTSITVTQAGTYTCVGTDINTGCSGTASATIFPLPDFCIVPQGCYEVCNPDTVCGPSGMASYQWNLNGNPISGETNQCIVITQSGIYSLTATTVNGCSETSADLELTVIDCDDPCAELEIDFEYLIVDGQTDSCCAVLSYTNNFGSLQGFTISTSDADLNFNLGSLSTQLSVQSISANSIALASNPGGNDIPTGTLSNFIEFCISNVVNSPQQIIINWYDWNSDVVCADTLEFECPAEPDCIYMTNDSIWCDLDILVYQFTVCNPADNPFDIEYITINPSSPAGIVVTPPFIDASANPITPGTCQTFILTLSGPSLGGETFCYNLIGHNGNPDENDSTLCCSLDTLYCIDIPYCNPCELVWVEFVESDTTDACCHIINLYNGYDPNYFTGIGVNVISPSTTITVNNPFGSGWTTSGYTPTNVTFLPGNVFNNYVPGGTFPIPQICVQTNIAPCQLIEITWLVDSTVVCRDTVEICCEPPCGYIYDESIVCDPATGQWVYTGTIKNTSNTTINQAVFNFYEPAGMSVYDFIQPLGSLTPGSVSAPFTINIGAPAMPGDTVCYLVGLHEVNPDSLDVFCCYFTHCFVLPDCAIQEPDSCLCDSLEVHVNNGISYMQVSGTTYQFHMADLYFFDECDVLRWNFNDGSPILTAAGNDIVTHTFPAGGLYTICVKITRYADDGEICYDGLCITIDVPGIIVQYPQSPEAQQPEVQQSSLFDEPELMLIYPNPNKGEFKIMLYDEVDYPLDIVIYNSLQQPVYVQQVALKADSPVLNINLDDQSKGLYMLQLRMGQQTFTRKIIVY